MYINKDIMKSFVPSTIFPISSISAMVGSNRVSVLRARELSRQLVDMTDAYERYKYRAFRELHTNNWLRMHGYPLKRKGGKRIKKRKLLN